MVSAEALATVNVRVITKLYIYIDRKERQRPAFNYLELNQTSYLDMVMVHLIYRFVKLQLHDAIYRLRFYSNSLIHVLSLSNWHYNVASIQKNRGDKSYRVIVP